VFGSAPADLYSPPHVESAHPATRAPYRRRTELNVVKFMARNPRSAPAVAPVVVLGSDLSHGWDCAQALNAAGIATEYLHSLDAYLERSTPQVLVLDIAPGDIDVCTVIPMLRRLSPSPGLVLLSAHGASVLRSFAANAKSVGVDVIGTLLKPADPALLVALVTGRLEQEEHAPPAAPPRPAPKPLAAAEILNLLDAGAAETFLQPKFRLKDLEIVGFEALVRMNHPELGVLTPARFLDALLANGAGPALTHRMLQGTAQSLKRLAQYNPAGDWTYAVNVTGDLPIQDNPQWLRKHVEAVGLDPASLIIEVPEGTLSNDVSAWHRVLTQARLMGSGVSLDDFGCHAANLERLLLLPLSEVKVDRMFLEHAVHDQDARRLLESMNLMIKNLGLVSVVEGISSPEMLAIAVDAGFDLGQGFHLGVPLSLSATEALLAARNPAA